MPALIAALLAQIWPVLARAAFSVLVTAAQKAGVINGVEAYAVRKEHDFVSAVQTLKTYPQYPTGRNGESG